MAQKRFFNKLRIPFHKKNLSIAKKALRKVNKLARRVRPEQKIHDIGSSLLQPNIAGAVTHLSAIAQGDSETTRDGLQLRVFFMEFRFEALKDTVPTKTQIRLIIFRDNRQVESTIPSVLDVLLAAVPISQYSRVNPKRFTIFWSKIITLRTNRIAMSRTVTKKLNFPIRYVGAGSGTQTLNGLYLLSESNALATEEPNIRFTFRLRFTDV